jgi:hypothetical protein
MILQKVGARMKTTRIMVSRPALMARINRRLARDERQLYAARNVRTQLDLGSFYIIDTRRNLIVDRGVDPEELARELGVLKEWEATEGF